MNWTCLAKTTTRKLKTSFFRLMSGVWMARKLNPRNSPDFPVTLPAKIAEEVAGKACRTLVVVSRREGGETKQSSTSIYEGPCEYVWTTLCYTWEAKPNQSGTTKQCGRQRFRISGQFRVCLDSLSENADAALGHLLYILLGNFFFKRLTWEAFCRWRLLFCQFQQGEKRFLERAPKHALSSNYFLVYVYGNKTILMAGPFLADIHYLWNYMSYNLYKFFFFLKHI